MPGKLSAYIFDHKKKIVFFMVSLCLSVTITGSTVFFGILGPLAVLALAVSGAFLINLFLDPRTGVWVYIAYCFILGFLVKYFFDIPVGLVLDITLLLTWGSILVNMKHFNWHRLKNEHVVFSMIWFAISFMQVLNPYGGSFTGWLNELRFAALSWLLVSPVVFLLFNSRIELNRFITVILVFSLVATLYGMKQLYFGVSAGEQLWLNSGNGGTHIINGKLRVFSMYSDAGQFGASQAIMAVIALTLATGPFGTAKKILFVALAMAFLYGMAISGTRGALFALAAGIFTALFLSRNFKVLIVGVVICMLGFGLLKYSNIGNHIFQVNRLRSALDPKDASFAVRLDNQHKLGLLLEDLPFGAGLGLSGMNGTTYNADKPIANIPPDSYWVKVWVMYGVVGLVIWFFLTCYILGKCCGISWRINDPKLRTKVVALTAGTVACFICSYGNEVMNGMPSSVIMFISWSFIFISPGLDQKQTKSEADGTNI